jgi:hypothetical protein
LVKTALIDQSTALSRSASSKTRLAPLPPSSRLTGVRFAPAARAMTRPVADSPVKVMRSTSGCSVSAAPAESGP